MCIIKNQELILRLLIPIQSLRGHVSLPKKVNLIDDFFFQQREPSFHYLRSVYLSVYLYIYLPIYLFNSSKSKSSAFLLVLRNCVPPFLSDDISNPLWPYPLNSRHSSLLSVSRTDCATSCLKTLMHVFLLLSAPLTLLKWPDSFSCFMSQLLKNGKLIFSVMDVEKHTQPGFGSDKNIEWISRRKRRRRKKRKTIEENKLKLMNTYRVLGSLSWTDNRDADRSKIRLRMGPGRGEHWGYLYSVGFCLTL